MKTTVRTLRFTLMGLLPVFDKPGIKLDDDRTRIKKPGLDVVREVFRDRLVVARPAFELAIQGLR
ncbi:hypothetical protein D3C84_1306550 [compost metagenome]